VAELLLRSRADGVSNTLFAAGASARATMMPSRATKDRIVLQNFTIRIDPMRPGAL
jgi:hypothetical protein